MMQRTNTRQARCEETLEPQNSMFREYISTHKRLELSGNGIKEMDMSAAYGSANNLTPNPQPRRRSNQHRRVDEERGRIPADE